jgi:tetratricopeptide (TPR) repeat protein
MVEPLAARLIEALHRTGRVAEALDCYTAIRRHLVEALGTEPGPELRRALLAGTGIAVAGPAPGPAPVPAAAAAAAAGRGRPPVLAQLPPDASGFAARAAELARLDALLAAAGDQPTAVLLIAVTGPAGVGKTTLAVHWANRVAARFPDGQLYVDLRGFDRTGAALDAGAVLRAFLDALQLAPERRPATLAAQINLYRSLLAARRMLVLLDNAADAGQVRPLLPGAPGCVVLVTSRTALTELVEAERAEPVRLDLLSPAEGTELLAARLGRERVAAEPAAVDQIVDRCARLPLALAVVAARAAAQPARPLAQLAAELRGGSTLDRLAEAGSGGDVRAALSLSYQRLDPAAARLFRLLGLLPGPDVGIAAAASLAGVPVPAALRALAELTDAHLLTELASGRYACHDLLRDYAAERVDQQEPAVQRRAALRRVLDHYLHTGYTAARLLDPTRKTIPLNPRRPDVTPQPLADSGEAMAWYATERRALLAAVTLAAGAGFDQHAWRLAWTLADYLNWQNYWADWVSVEQTGLAVLRRLGDRPGQARAHGSLAIALSYQGSYPDSHAHLRSALRLYEQLGDRAGQALTQHRMCVVLHMQERYREALEHAERALQLLQGLDDRRSEAAARNALGYSYAQLGDHEQALVHCQRALVELQRVGDRVREAHTWHSLGRAHQHLGHRREAVTSYRRASERYAEIGDRYYEAATLDQLADAHQAAGDPAAAVAAWHRALRIFTELGDPAASEVQTKIANHGAGG